MNNISLNEGGATGGMKRFDPLLLESEADSWPELREGVRICILQENLETGTRTALLRYDPGATVPPHRHLAEEHIHVLSGWQEDETGTQGKGVYSFNPAGSVHSVHSPGGCLVWIHWNGPIEFLNP